LLSTPPHSDAVTFSYGALANPGSDFHRTKWAPSRAHSSRTWSGISKPRMSASSATSTVPVPAL